MRYCHRPFASVDEMDATLIQNINARVGRGDLLYHLGDWSFRDAEKFRKRINCPNIHFIMGNHDKDRNVYERIFTTVRDLNKITIRRSDRKYELVLCHYAMRVWNKSHHGVWHLYGHSHNTLPDDPNSLSFDVGVDAVAQRAIGMSREDHLADWTDQLSPDDYRPISLDEVEALMETKAYKPVDHHGNR